jgi:hypothetical protein
LFWFQFRKSGGGARFRVFNGRVGSGHIAEICLWEAIRSSRFAKEIEKMGAANLDKAAKTMSQRIPHRVLEGRKSLLLVHLGFTR